MNDTEVILSANSYCVLATTCKDNSPWAVPIHFANDSKYIYWFSQDSTVHSQNIARNGSVFMVIFDSQQTANAPGGRGAVYISTEATRLVGDAAKVARDIYTDRYPNEKGSEKVTSWSVYCAPIGDINESKSVGKMIYHHYKKEDRV